VVVVYRLEELRLA
jgi:hypothetical protein